MRTILKQRNFCEKLADYEGIPCFIEGVTGVGKSQLVFELGKKVGREVIYIAAATLEGIDAAGLPMVTDQNNVQYTLPAFLKKINKTDKYIFFIDELKRSPMDTQQALLNLFNPVPYVGTHDLSQYDFWAITADNDSDIQEGVNVSDYDIAYTTRGGRFLLEADLKDTAKYLENKYGKTVMTTFLNSVYAVDTLGDDFRLIFGENQDEHVTPVSRVLELAVRLTQRWSANDYENKHDLLNGLMGKPLKAAFLNYIESVKSIDPSKILSGRAKTILKEKLSMTEYDSEAIIVAFQKASTMVKRKEQGKNLFNMLSLLKEYPAVYNSVINSLDKENRVTAATMAEHTDSLIDSYLDNSLASDEDLLNE